MFGEEVTISDSVCVEKRRNQLCDPSTYLLIPSVTRGRLSPSYYCSGSFDFNRRDERKLLLASYASCQMVHHD